MHRCKSQYVISCLSIFGICPSLPPTIVLPSPLFLTPGCSIIASFLPHGPISTGVTARLTSVITQLVILLLWLTHWETACWSWLTSPQQTLLSHIKIHSFFRHAHPWVCHVRLGPLSQSLLCWVAKLRGVGFTLRDRTLGVKALRHGRSLCKTED